MHAYSRVVLMVLATAVAVSAIPCGPTLQCTAQQNCRLSPGQNGQPYSFSCSVDACANVAICPTTAPFCDLTGSSPVCTLMPGGGGGGTGGLTGGFGPGLPSFATGGFGTSCTTAADCTQSGFSCVAGFCLPGANAACPSTCATNTVCQYGVCVPLPNAPCDPACSSGQVCLFGQCLTATSTCSPACDSNSICGPNGNCIPTASATCAPGCPNPFTCEAGKCVPPQPTCSPTCTAPQVCGVDVAQLSAGVNPFAASAGAAAAVSYKCLTPPTSANTGVCSPTCSSTQVCALGTCINKPPFPIGTGANDVSQAALDALVSGAINVGSLPNPAAAPAGGAAAAFNGNSFTQVAGGANVQYPSMSFAPSAGAPSTGAQAQGAFNVGAGSTVTSASFAASIPNLGVVVNNGARFACNQANIAVNATVTYSFAAVAAGQQAGQVVLDQLQLNGQVVVSGAGSFQFPMDPARVTVGASAGAVQFSSGASVSGNAAGAAIQVNSGVGGSAQVNVAANTRFTTSGNVLGSSSGTLQVNGEFAFAGASIQPQVNIGATGSMRINGTACQTGDVTIAAGGSLTVAANGRGVRVGVLRGCPAGATITYQATGSFAAGTASSGTILNFAAGTSSSAFACGVRVVDSTGAVATLSARSSPRTASGLFGNIFEQSGSATFTASSLTYSGAQADSAAPSAFAPANALIAAVTLVAAAAARRFL